MRSISVISLAMVVWRSSVIRRSWSQNSGSTLIEVLWPSRTTVRVNGDCSRFIDRSMQRDPGLRPRSSRSFDSLLHPGSSRNNVNDRTRGRVQGAEVCVSQLACHRLASHNSERFWLQRLAPNPVLSVSV